MAEPNAVYPTRSRLFRQCSVRGCGSDRDGDGDGDSDCYSDRDGDGDGDCDSDGDGDGDSDSNDFSDCDSDCDCDVDSDGDDFSRDVGVDICLHLLDICLNVYRRNSPSNTPSIGLCVDVSDGVGFLLETTSPRQPSFAREGSLNLQPRVDSV